MLDLGFLATTYLIKLILLGLLSIFSLFGHSRCVLALELSFQVLYIGQKFDSRMANDKEELRVVHISHILPESSSAKGLGVFLVRVDLVEALGQVVNEALGILRGVASLDVVESVQNGL